MLSRAEAGSLVQPMLSSINFLHFWRILKILKSENVHHILIYRYLFSPFSLSPFTPLRWRTLRFGLAKHDSSLQIHQSSSKPRITWDGWADDVIHLGVLQGKVPDHLAAGEQALQARAADTGHAQVKVLQSENCLLIQILFDYISFLLYFKIELNLQLGWDVPYIESCKGI